MLILYRFTKHEIRIIISYLDLDSVPWRCRVKPSSETAFCILLARLSYPWKEETLGALFGCSTTWISIVFCDILQYLQYCYSGIICWHPLLTYTKVQSYAQSLHEAGGLPGIWGFLDGTFRPICRPTDNQEFYYSGYKKSHGFKYQSIVTSDGLIPSFIEPFEGKMNDQSIFLYSGLEENLLQLLDKNKPLYLYGDSGYSHLYTIITPYLRRYGLSSSERQFNLELSRDRISVEQTFGLIINLWKANAFKILLRSQSMPVAAFYEVALLLTNCFICLWGNQVSKHYNIKPPNLEKYLVATGLYYLFLSL